mmetsp:Transcript_94564/g.282402  ORF Transcript_94564/g.282402 Transcript_94564/m.282402 type:complete len:222 (+) Transcript_94564:930-1595(+)
MAAAGWSPGGAQEGRQVRHAGEFEGLGRGCCPVASDMHRRSEAARCQGGDGIARALERRAARKHLRLEEARPRDGRSPGGRARPSRRASEDRDQALEAGGEPCAREAGAAASSAAGSGEPPSAERLRLRVPLLLVPGHLLGDPGPGPGMPGEANGGAELVRLQRQPGHGRAGPMRRGDEGLLAEHDIHDAAGNEEGPGDAECNDDGRGELPRLDVLRLCKH